MNIEFFFCQPRTKITLVRDCLCGSRFMRTFSTANRESVRGWLPWNSTWCFVCCFFVLSLNNETERNSKPSFNRPRTKTLVKAKDKSAYMFSFVFLSVVNVMLGSQNSKIFYLVYKKKFIQNKNLRVCVYCFFIFIFYYDKLFVDVVVIIFSFLF